MTGRAAPAGEIVRSMREMYGISRPVLARRSGVTASKIRALELGLKQGLPNSDEVVQLLEALRGEK